MSKLVHIQLLRALAALSVAFLHAQHDAVLIAQRAGRTFAPPDRFPWMAGVDIFFVISGFIMVYTSRDLFAAPRAQGIFLARRIARIVPLYWAMTTLYLVVALAVPNLLNHEVLSGWPVLASYLFIPFARLDGPTQPLLTLGWTLNYEMFFYILFALVLFFRKKVALLLLLGLLAGFVVVGRLHPLSQPWAFWTDPIILEFAFGVVLGWLRLRSVVLGRMMRGILALGGLFCLAASLVLLRDMAEIMRPVAWGLPAALLVAAAALGPDSPARTSWVTWLGVRVGDISYALYLVHPFVIRPISHAFERNSVGGTVGLWVFMAMALLAAVAASAVVHLWFERPVTAWVRRALEPVRRSQRDLPGEPA